MKIIVIIYEFLKEHSSEEPNYTHYMFSSAHLLYSKSSNISTQLIVYTTLWLNGL
jgi:hypothetical protein